MFIQFEERLSQSVLVFSSGGSLATCLTHVFHILANQERLQRASYDYFPRSLGREVNVFSVFSWLLWLVCVFAVLSVFASVCCVYCLPIFSRLAYLHTLHLLMDLYVFEWGYVEC